eukprot:6550765-Prymnesium_polylepis.1
MVEPGRSAPARREGTDMNPYWRRGGDTEGHGMGELDEINRDPVLRLSVATGGRDGLGWPGSDKGCGPMEPPAVSACWRSGK